ncbi:MAG TPA: hypothetical protein VJ225_00125 [Nitrososphaeraceae archaeon]|nr:hypothetical protein [Nitrososphaeraceae archaeon]
MTRRTPFRSELNSIFISNCIEQTGWTLSPDATKNTAYKILAMKNDIRAV